ncbi:Succinylglutamate desuccinylase / Aspartoacylase family protein [Aquiflexum balticum DSM 16537]|uniref:Succinylglutamate desuccinylase / Aspartoacylase family protein n=1 Tax=Aquiflexum balticum DSM 16537 TaxID=758820 RepID=A0A1W2H9P0_9BACT|nr:succinylglutamate desuccinylase/aspartoacylase family protein [Aquiflexum balticum]SMD45603.1 Succinylglutamate desuccinylase / Aspartoacylase family protein [Aquiflexum balticum DSM 16537]
MIEIYSKALQEKITIDRLIGRIETGRIGPTLVFFAGIHGNEVAGVFALKKVFEDLENQKEKLRGTVIGISGNLKALAVNTRYLKEDLNRLWTKSNIKRIVKNDKPGPEEEELVAILQLVEEILEKGNGPFYFIDLHTTSSKTLPFITINDALINRKFSELFPVPIVLGIEEFLDGPLLSFINQAGYVAIGFESGQHDEKEAISNNIAFVYLCLVYARLIKKKSLDHYQEYYNELEQASKKVKEIFEITYLYQIMKGEEFKMLPGFESFQVIKKETPLAISNGEVVKSKYASRLFMPLYQSQGSDGFFIIRGIPKFALKLSSLLRKTKADNFLTLLPGIQWDNREKEILRVNLKIARFFTGPLFHLLGYRIRVVDENYLRLYNREHAVKTEMYRGEKWY